MKPQRIVNVHQAKTHLSRLIDDAHALLEPICQPNWPRGRAAAWCLGSPAMSDAAGYLLNSHVLLWWWFDPDRLPGPAQADGFQPLPITLAHGVRAGAYSQPHRDPLDRMLAGQAELERLVLLTGDQQLSMFPCRTLWA